MPRLLPGVPLLPVPQRRQFRRQKQLRAIVLWLKDLQDGVHNRPLQFYCDQVEVPSYGVQKVLQSQPVKDLIDATVLANAQRGVTLTGSLLVQRLEDEGIKWKSTELVQVGDHLEKIRQQVHTKGSETKGGNQVLVNINLPPGADYSEPVRVEAVQTARKELEGYVE